MYWEHGYTAEDIEQRLRLSKNWILAVIESSEWHEEWDEDTHAYRTVRRARTRSPKQALDIPATVQETVSKEEQIRQQLDRMVRLNQCM